MSQLAAVAIPSAGCEIAAVIFLKARCDGSSYIESQNDCYRGLLRRA
jgi:hypothetical protein